MLYGYSYHWFSQEGRTHTNLLAEYSIVQKPKAVKISIKVDSLASRFSFIKSGMRGVAAGRYDTGENERTYFFLD